MNEEQKRDRLRVILSQTVAITDVPPDLWETVEKATGLALANVRDPETMRRAAARMDQLRQEIYEREGLLDVSSALLREIRDSE